MQRCKGDKDGRTVGGDEEALFEFGEALRTQLVGLRKCSQMTLGTFIKENC